MNEWQKCVCSLGNKVRFSGERIFFRDRYQFCGKMLFADQTDIEVAQNA